MDDRMTKAQIQATGWLQRKLVMYPVGLGLRERGTLSKLAWVRLSLDRFQLQLRQRSQYQPGIGRVLEVAFDNASRATSSSSDRLLVIRNLEQPESPILQAFTRP